MINSKLEECQICSYSNMKDDAKNLNLLKYNFSLPRTHNKIYRPYREWIAFFFSCELNYFLEVKPSVKIFFSILRSLFETILVRLLFVFSSCNCRFLHIAVAYPFLIMSFFPQYHKLETVTFRFWHNARCQYIFFLFW